MVRSESRAAPRSLSVSARLEQARREVGETRVTRATAALLAGLALLTLVAVPVLDSLAGERPGRWLAELGEGLSGAGAELARGRPVSANRLLQVAIDRAEEELEGASLVRERLLPPVQQAMTSVLGAGNEQVYPGRSGWLFYRQDVDYVIGPGFLEPRVMARRERGGDAWERAPLPDPLPALRAFGDDLRARGADLLLVPTPVKPTVHPEWMDARAAGAGPLQNASFATFLERLRVAGLAFFDPAPPLRAAANAGGEPLYLATDTHWTPAAMDSVAAALAERAAELLPPPTAATAYRRREVAVAGPGDVAAMLRLPAASSLFPAERVTVQRVESAAGGAWRPEPGAAVLLLGDSFTNVFSDPALGWGVSAGLAEQLAFHLRRPVDRIALNAGGAHAAREALARDPGRLRDTKLVIYQFATRELAFGDWRRVELAPPAARAD